MTPGTARVAVLASLAAVFLGLCATCWWHVMDDSYIAYRYSANLADGYGLVWNPGEDPVEGYTSFAWVVLHAAAIRAGVDPVWFSKVLSALAGLLILAILVRSARSVSWSLVVVLAGLLAMSPGFAVLTMQGLETTCTALVVLLLAVATERLARAPSSRHAVTWHALALGAALLRPDSVAFCAGAGLALLGRFIVARETRALRTWFLAAIPFLLVGAVYFAWRVQYFGHLLPNPAYVKFGVDEAAAARRGLSGVPYIASFLGRWFWPYLVLAAFAIWRAGGRMRRSAGVLPVAIGCLLFFAAVGRYTVIQGAFWRFLFPVVPAAVYLLLRLAPPRWRWSPRPLVAGMLVVAFLAWNLRFLPEAAEYRIRSGTVERARIGKVLAGLDGKLFTSASGAIPYYSGWRTYDKLGLTNERIAHEGLSVEILEEIGPELILVASAPDGLFTSIQFKHGRETRYMMRAGGFRPVAAIRMRSGLRMYAFARESSPRYDEVVRRLGSLDSREEPEPGLDERIYRPESPPRRDDPGH